MSHDHAAAEALLRTGLLVSVRVVDEVMTPGPDEGELGLHLNISFDADYLRGRRMKTQARVRADGTGFIETVGRGKSATHWIARLQGRQLLRAVGQ